MVTTVARKLSHPAFLPSETGSSAPSPLASDVSGTLPSDVSGASSSGMDAAEASGVLTSASITYPSVSGSMRLPTLNSYFVSSASGMSTSAPSVVASTGGLSYRNAAAYAGRQASSLAHLVSSGGVSGGLFTAQPSLELSSDAAVSRELSVADPTSSGYHISDVPTAAVGASYSLTSAFGAVILLHAMQPHI